MDNIIEKERSVCYHRGEGNGKCSGVGVKPHSAVSSFQNAFSARTGQGLRDTGIPTHTMLRAALKHKEVIPFGASRRSRHTQCCVRH